MPDRAPHYAGHRQRIKGKYLSGGLAAWADYEVLELILGYAIARRDTKPLAKVLVERFGTLAGVLEAAPAELRAVPGVSDHTAVLLKLFKDVAAAYLRGKTIGRDVIASPESAVQYLSVLLKSVPDEEFHVLLLDTANRVLAVETLQRGTVNKAVVYPRTVVERALLGHAAGVILVHNHPGGSLQPSPEDLQATGSIRRALDAVEVALLDHLIIARTGYYSWKEHGLL
jgi:DNA repair protein RadC